MAETSEKPVTPAAPAAKVVIKTAPTVITPSATRIEMQPVAIALEKLKNLKPDGNPHPEVIDAAKDAVEDLVKIFPQADACEILIETNFTPTGARFSAQVTTKKWN